MNTKVCIIGAGPAGSTAALYLNKHQIDHIIIDKAHFPRNVVCGEAMRGNNIYWALKHLNEGWYDELQSQVVKNSHWVRLVNNKNEQLEINLGETSSLMGRRVDLDNFLIEKMKQGKHTTFLEGQTPKNIQYIPNEGYQLEVNGTTIQSKLLIVATGATSTLPQKLGIPTKENLKKVIGMRAHFRGVDLEKGSTDIYFFDFLEGGYFWIFPLFGGYFNVGMAVKDDFLKANNYKVSDLYQRCLEYSTVAYRFKNATMEGKSQGKFLYLPQRKVPLSTDHLLVAGAAGMAVNPITGFGVGHSMTLGRFAGVRAAEAIEANNFSASFLKQYDKAVLKKLKPERLVADIKTYLLSKPNTYNRLISYFSKRQSFKNLFSQEDLAKNFYNPIYYWKHLMNRKKLIAPYR